MITHTPYITSNIGNTHVKFEIYSFIKIVTSYFNIRSYHEEEILYIFKSTWSERTYLYNRIKYENVVLAITAFVMRKDENFNIYPIIPSLYSEKIINYNLCQIYSLLQMFTDILLE